MSKHSRRVWLGAGLVAVAVAATSPPPAMAASDPWLTTKVKASLLTADGVDGLDINVDTMDGLVTLHGTAASATEKTRAEQLARQVEGVRDVRNLIQVVPKAEAEAIGVLDEDLEERVTKALRDEPELAGSRITVQSVNQGAVLLGGTAETLSAHLRALETARDVDGVRRVESQIQSPDRLADNEIWRDAPADVSAGGTGMAVRSSANDLWITSAAKVRLMAADVPAFDINVDTREGEVTLFGMVPSEEQKRAAEAEVRKVDGVKSVENELQVVAESRQPAVARKDEEIHESVVERIGSHDDLSDADIDVEVRGGVVRLTGSVTSQEDRLAALTAARRSEGVRSVVGDLRVERN
jgi:hyperosmotically inducible periplasmic protein